MHRLITPASEHKHLACAGFIFLSMLWSCRQDDALFTKLESSATGIDFINWSNETEATNILTYEYLYNGGGVALGDINNDGLIDIYFTSTDNDNKLYLNLGNFRFEDITDRAGVAAEPGWKTGVSLADVNGDGWLDIYICRSAHANPSLRKNILLINNHDLTFTDKAHAFGLDDDSYSTQAAFFDFDRDGDLDVFLLNHSLLSISNSYDIYLKNTSKRYPFVGNKLLRNDGGTFVDVSDSVGVFGPGSNYGLGVSLSDLNNDGWTDLYAGCDYTGKDKLLINEEGKRFHDRIDSLSHISKFTMGTDIADINGDGLMDICTLDMLPENNFRQKQLFGSDRYDVFQAMVKSGLHHQYMRNMLHLNLGNGAFSEVGQLAGISNTDWSWAALFSDYDNDGVQDLFVSNGFKRDLTDNDFAKYKAFQEIEASRRQGKAVSVLKIIDKFSENKLPNYIFQGKGDLSFEDRTRAWGLSQPSLTNGAAYGDLDNDGDLDLVMNCVNERAFVYRNNADRTPDHHYLKIGLEGRDLNTQAIGARVAVYASGKTFVRESYPVRGFQSSVDPTLHIGLGSSTYIDSLEIRWPNGEVQALGNVRADTFLRVHQPAQLPSLQNAVTSKAYFTSDQGHCPDFTHRENDFNDFTVQALLPQRYSTSGPAFAQADINGDGFKDIYIGGAKGQSSVLFVQDQNGKFKPSPQSTLDQPQSEKVAALFFDMDTDGDNDLYVVTGGYEFKPGDPLLGDRLYENTGHGIFKEKTLPAFSSSGSCVKAADVDLDGDLDLFVGGRIIPGRYPETPQSYLLINDGHGNFTPDASLDERLKFAGMVTDAAWTDLDHDRDQDLVVVGEWMPIRVFVNEKGKFTEQSHEYVPDKTEGWWNCILADDLDADGDVDLLVGNRGSNSQFKATSTQPVSLVYADFDRNGSIDPVIGLFIQGKNYPYATRDELTEQLPAFKKRFPNYRSYSQASLNEVFTKEEYAAATKLYAFRLETSLLMNDSGRFRLRSLPVEFQVAPVYSLVSMDVNNDGKTDIISGGNLSGTRARTGKLTGNNGFVFLSEGHGKFRWLPPLQSGINVQGDVRGIVRDENRLFFAENNGHIKGYVLDAGTPSVARVSIK